MLAYEHVRRRERQSFSGYTVGQVVGVVNGRLGTCFLLIIYFINLITSFKLGSKLNLRILSVALENIPDLTKI